ncbi:unnamed protein product, partial [Ectocarpus sp. 8 AP-2014]
RQVLGRNVLQRYLQHLLVNTSSLAEALSSGSRSGQDPSPERPAILLYIRRCLTLTVRALFSFPPQIVCDRGVSCFPAETTSTTGTSSAIAGGVVSSYARCGAAGTGRYGSRDGDDRPASAVLTIEAPTPSSRGGGGGGGGSGSGWTCPLRGYNQSGEGGRGRPRSAGSDKSCPETTAPAARHRQNRDRSGTGAGDGFLRIRATANAPLTSTTRTKTAPVFSTSEAGTEERGGISTAAEAVGNASGRFSPPPPSPASSRARSMTSPPGGSFSIAWSNGGTDAVTPANSTQVGVAGGSGLIGPGVVGVGRGDTERSFFSTASSEPRYHCLRSGLSSPAWSNAGSWTGSADGAMPVDMSDALSSSSGEEEEEEEEE